ncbi:MAG TPA: hypothetical protein VK914_05620 [bacterium]|jgi:hypothetical protein|nr:hypothetical protein [bacterium]
MEDRFTSNYSPADLLGRLKNSAEVDAFLEEYAGVPPVSVTLNGARLTLKKLRNYRDSLAPVFHGVVLEREEGSVILGHFSPQPYLFLALTLTLAGVGWTLLPSQAAYRSHPALLITPIVFLFCAAAIVVSRWIGRGEKYLLEAYLETCCMTPAPMTAPGKPAEQTAETKAAETKPVLSDASMPDTGA